ncbi:MAG: alpha-2-macroglobulin family protein, partial [Pseudomonadota bacterium]
VIAWSGTKVGDGAIDVTVRDPVVVVGTLPRFLAPGDATRMRFDLHNVAYQAGTFDLSVNAVGPVVVGALGDTIELMRDGRDTLEVPLTATAAGTAEIEATLTGPDGLSLTSHYTLTVRSAAPVVAERRLVAVMPGDTAILQAPVALGFSDTATLSVTVGQGDLDTEGLIAMLDRFPYGCAEQTVSRALPLLYVNDLEKLVGAREDVAVAERIEKAISRLLAYQSASGGFGLWNPGSDLWLTAYVMDFLSRAREAGYGVPQSAFEAGLDRLQSLLSFLGDLSGERSTEIAYASYVLARNGRAAIGDLRYLAEEKIDDFASPLARAQLAASLAFTGDQALADRLFGEAVVGASFDERPNRGDYGTPLRDAAAMVTLASESRAPARIMDQLTGLLDRERTGIGERAYSTQEAAWLVLSAREDLEAPIDAVVAGTRTIRPGSRTFATVEPAGVTVENLGDAPLSVAATVTGTPLSPLAPVASGLSITRTYHGLDGSNVALDNVAQNARLIVRLTFEKTVESAMRVMLTDLLPAGFEVENPRLMGGRVPGVPMVRQGAAPEYIEFRDDRFAAAWNLPRGNVNQPITVSYVVRAVSPGTFALPAAEVSDMYQPQYVARTDAGALAIRPVR